MRIAFSGDERILAVQQGQELAVWELESSKLRHKIDLQGRVKALALSRDGVLAAVKGFRELTLYDTADGRKVTDLETGGWIETLIFAADTQIAVAGAPDLKTPETLDWDTRPLDSARANFRPRARMLARATPSGEAEILSLSGPKRSIVFPHEGSVNSVALSPDGKFLAAASAADLRVYDIDSREELARIPGGGEYPRFSPDSALIAALVGDEVKIYPWRRKDLVREACSRVVRNLTCEEWNRYVGSDTCQAVCPNLPPPHLSR